MCRNILPIAVTCDEVRKLSLGFLLCHTTMFLHPASKLFADAGCYRQLIMNQLAPLFNQLATALHPDALITIPVHDVQAFFVPCVDL